VTQARDYDQYMARTVRPDASFSLWLHTCMASTARLAETHTSDFHVRTTCQIFDALQLCCGVLGVVVVRPSVVCHGCIVAKR